MREPLVSRRIFLTLAAGAAAAPVRGAPVPTGRTETLGSLGSGDPAELRVRVWLPPGYDRADRRYRTLYMLDGQFAFAGDAGGNNFAADRHLAGLAATGRIDPALIVAIDSPKKPGDRFRLYMPETIYDQAVGDLRAALDRERAGQPLASSRFLQFVTTKLKPFIDATYRTLPGRADTAILGASMAGPMAAAAFIEGQEAFGRAACISPQWPLYDARFIEHPQLLSLWPDYFARLGAPGERRLWMDHGTLMMDAGMAPHQVRITRRLKRMGWLPGRNLEARVHRGAGHAFARSATQMRELLAWLLA